MSSLADLTPWLESLREARRRTLALVADLDDEQMIGPRLAIVNPLRWEIGHVAWFQEYWLLRHVLGRTPTLASGDSLFDSAKVAHDTRWDLPLPSKAEVIAYTQTILDRVCEEYHKGHDDSNGLSQAARYFLPLALFHEDMHAEAVTYTRQTLGYPAPKLNQTTLETTKKPSEKLGDAFIPGGTFLLGNATDQPFVFDNELDAHEVPVQPFSISRTAVTNAEFAAFVDDRGYERRELWSDDGWRWREATGAKHPVYWKSDAGKWCRRNFAEIVPLEDSLPALHVNWYEADAFCRWAHRRLPTEAEWEMAAAAEPITSDNISHKRRFPWGDEPPAPQRANLDWQNMGVVDVSALPESDSAFGCRQMIGNVWEWTASDFLPYPGFAAGPYKEYSEPWFGDHKVLRGGCWTTRSRLIHNTYRNFYKPDRRDVWCGFRTCAV